MAKFDFSKLGTGKYETNSYTVEEEYRDIALTAKEADIAVLPAADGKTTVVCCEEIKARHEVAVKDGILTVTCRDERAWYERIGIRFTGPKITLYLPAGAYGALSVKLSTGKTEIPSDSTFESIQIEANAGEITLCASVTEDIRLTTTTGKIFVSDVRAKDLTLSATAGTVTVQRATLAGNLSLCVSTGKSMLSAITCESLTSTGSTGDLSLENLIAKGEIAIKRSTGDIAFTACDGASLSVTTDTGDVAGTLLTGKDFRVKTGTGKIKIPEEREGGICRITTDTGSIKITVTSQDKDDVQ